MIQSKRNDWEASQIKTFTAWVNYHLSSRKIHVDNICTDFSDGVKLINLLEVIYKDSVGKYYDPPRNRTFAIENANIALQFMNKKGVPHHGISAEDIVDGRITMLLGMTWSIARHFELEK